jgi:hypothetical protein
MKNIISNISFALLGIVLLAGCQSSGSNTSSSTDTNKPAVTSPVHVAILYSKPKRAYTELGGVSTPKPQGGLGQQNPGATWQSALQTQAAAQGADAVIVDTSTLNNINTPMVSGTAIRYQ